MRRLLPHRLLLPVPALLLASGCLMTKEEGRHLQAQLKSLEVQLDQTRAQQKQEKTNLRKAIREVFDELKEKEKSDSLHKADLGVELEALRQELQKLIGKMEEADFQRQKLATDVAAQVAGGEPRIADIETQVAALIESVRRLQAFTDRFAGEDATLVAVTLPKPESPKQEYEQAVGLLRLGDTAQGRERLLAFRKAHRKDKLAGNAQYWLGESYYAEGDYRRAILEFQKVREKYSRSDKVDDALLKLGFCFAGLCLAKEAQVFLKELIRAHPKSRLVGKAKAKLKALKNQKQCRPVTPGAEKEKAK